MALTSSYKRLTQIDQLLLQDFGLSVNAKWHRKAAMVDTPWTDDENREWRQEHELLTIICYLTLPTRSYNAPRFSVSEFKIEVIQSADLAVVQSSFVQISTMVEQTKRVKQFQLALSALGLKPYIHPSQLQHTISAERDMQMEKEAKIEQAVKGDKDSKDESLSDDDQASSGKLASTLNSVNAEGESWPRLIQIVSASLTA